MLGLPITFLIDRDGKVIANFKGETDMDALESQVKELLERSSTMQRRTSSVAKEFDYLRAEAR